MKAEIFISRLNKEVDISHINLRGWVKLAEVLNLDESFCTMDARKEDVFNAVKNTLTDTEIKLAFWSLQRRYEFGGLETRPSSQFQLRSEV